MADTPISGFTDGVTANATDRIAAARSPFGAGDNRYITPPYIETFMQGRAQTWTQTATFANVVIGSSNSLAWSTDLFLVRDAANTLGQRNGTSTQAWNLYNTYSSAGSNYERLNIFFSSGFYIIGPQNAGTGSGTISAALRGNTIAFQNNNGASTRWTIDSSGHLMGGTDNTYDIGASGATRPRTGYFGTSVITPAATITTSTLTTVNVSGVTAISTNGALSAPAWTATGTWVTGGTGTTTKPYVLIETTGATSTGWSTSGTGLGINAASGFSGHLMRLAINNTQVMYVSNQDAGVNGYFTTQFGWLMSDGSLKFTSKAVGMVGDALVYWTTVGGNPLTGGDTSLARATVAVTSIGGNLASVGGTWRAIPTTPAQVTSNQDNYNPGGTSYFQRWSTDASRDVTGLTFTNTQVNGQVHRIVNVGAQDIVLKHNVTSTAANRFQNSTGADITLTAGQAADIIYDATSSGNFPAWRVYKKN